ncbi:MAG: 7TM diverse intracellular signaling domain-containing protein [Rhodoferax sp.]
MHSSLVRLLLTLLLLCAGTGWAAAPSPAGAIVLDDGIPSRQIDSTIETWLDTGSQATIATVAANPRNFEVVPALTRLPLTERDTLWIRLRVVRVTGSPSTWSLNIPLPELGSVTLYQRDAARGWTVQTAGSSLAQTDWSNKGLYPEFDLNLPSGTVQDIYLQVRNFKPVSVPIRLISAPKRDLQRLWEFLSLGLMLGALLTMALLSLIRYLEHRNPVDVKASLYGLLILTTVAQLNGVLGTFVWGPLSLLNDYAYNVIPAIAVGCALLFVRDLYALSNHYRRFDAFLSSTGWGTVASVLSYAVLNRFTAEWVSCIVLLFAAAIGLLATVLSWRSGAQIGRWLILAYVPQFLGAMYLTADAFGLVPPLWGMRYLMSLSIALSVPIMMYALSRVTHDRKELVVRANRLPTQDALTGLLTAEIFQNHLAAAVQRCIENREPVALVLVHVVNHEHIREVFGDTTAEQCLLRAVIKIQRILRDVDPAGRIDTAHFGLLMEGITTRKALTERMVQLIASGLIPLPGLEPEVTLQFQVACVMLHENPVPPERVLADLKEVLEGMSLRTRRPIRFLEPVPTQPAELQSEMDTV